MSDAKLFTPSEIEAMLSEARFLDRAPGRPVLWADLPWPPRSLSPNVGIHYRAKAAAILQQKALVTARCVEQLGRPSQRVKIAELLHGNRDPLWVGLLFSPPDRRRRDLDNLVASTKSSLDALANFLGVDDSRISVICARLTRAVTQHGLVRVAVTVANPEAAASPDGETH